MECAATCIGSEPITLACLNPCSNGMRRDKNYLKEEDVRKGLNPCSNGMRRDKLDHGPSAW